MRSLIASLLVLLALATSSALVAQTPADRERARIQNRLGWEYMRVEDWEQAARYFQRAIDADATYAYAHYSLGRANLAMRQFAAAIAALERCRALHAAESGRRFANAKDAQRYRNDRVTEINEVMRQLRSGPQTSQVQEQLRQLQNQIRDLQDALQRGANVTLQTSVPAYVTLSLGSAYFRAGRLEDAEREYKATIAADPRSGEAHNNLAVVYFETGRYAEADAAVQAARRAGFRVHPDLEREIKERRKRAPETGLPLFRQSETFGAGATRL